MKSGNKAKPGVAKGRLCPMTAGVSDAGPDSSDREYTEILNSFFTDHVHELAEANVALRVSI